MTMPDKFGECSCCGSPLQEGRTNFTVVRQSSVHVVKDVPCLICSFCEGVTFTQETAEILDELMSGRYAPDRVLNAWVYDWQRPRQRVLVPMLPVGTRAWDVGFPPVTSGQPILVGSPPNRQS